MALLAVYHCKSSISVGWSLLTVFLGELLGILNKLLLVFRKLLCNVTWDQRDNNVVFLPARSALRGCSGSGSLTRETKDCITCSVLVAGFQFSAAMIGRHTCWRALRLEENSVRCHYLSFLVDVGVVDLRSEGDFGWLEGILWGEYDVYQKCTL